MTNKQKGIIYLDTNHIDYYQAGLTNVISIALPPTTAQNMEILNVAELQKLVTDFVQTNTITPTNVIALVSPRITFEKNFEKKIPDTSDAEITAYLDIVPFGTVISKKFPTETGINVIAANADFLNAIKKVFTEAGFIIEAFVLHNELNPQASTLQNLDLQEASQLIATYEKLKAFNLVVQEKIIPSANLTIAQEQEKNKNKPSKLFPLLVVILFIGIGVLIFILFKK